jgi:hypothetical protein
VAAASVAVVVAAGAEPEGGSRFWRWTSATAIRRSARVGYTRGMGAVDTMEQFFDLINSGDREGAVSLMDERAELRVHIAGNARTLKGLREVGGWFLRAEPGFRMIPGDVRDMGNTYQANLLVVRPGAPTQQLDASFRVEAGKITAINLTPR